MYDTGSTVDIDGVLHKIYIEEKHSESGNVHFRYKPVGNPYEVDTHNYTKWDFWKEPDNTPFWAKSDHIGHVDEPWEGTMFEKEPTKKHSHYFKPVEHLTEVDVYRVCDIFQVNDCSGATQHAIKKLLLPGQRGGGKSTRKDIKEAVDTLTRKLEMLDEDEHNGYHELPTSRV